MLDFDYTCRYKKKTNTHNTHTLNLVFISWFVTGILYFVQLYKTQNFSVQNHLLWCSSKLRTSNRLESNNPRYMMVYETHNRNSRKSKTKATIIHTYFVVECLLYHNSSAISAANNRTTLFPPLLPHNNFRDRICTHYSKTCAIYKQA